MQILEKISDLLNRLLTFLAGVFLLGMIVLTCANIIFRIAWIPIMGTFELMGFFGALVTAFALAYTQQKKGHIAVDVLVNTFPRNTRRILVIVNNALCCLFFALATWQIGVKACILKNTGEVTETLRIIYYPFTFAMAIGCFVLTLMLLIDLIRDLAEYKEDVN